MAGDLEDPRATLDKVVETSRNSRARLADSAERPIRATGGLMLFELPPERLPPTT
jgi:hypothetical protein